MYIRFPLQTSGNSDDIAVPTKPVRLFHQVDPQKGEEGQVLQGSNA